MRHLWVQLTGLMSLSALLFVSCGESSTGVEGDALSSSSSLVGSSSSSVVIGNTQTCVYAATGTTTGSTGTLTCAEKTYNTVVIGTQTWMAENLNYEPSSGYSWCYENDASNCDTYGRLYDWATANTVCPTGWHLPTNDEWTTLTDYVGGASTAGTKLRTVTGWTAYSGIINTDDYGFSALPAGYYSRSIFFSVSTLGCWWSATAGSASYAYLRRMLYSYADVSWYIGDKAKGLSVRCLED